MYNVNDIFDRELKKNNYTLVLSSKGVSKRLKISKNVNRYILFDEIKPNPNYQELINFLNNFSLKDIKTIIGIGGGSVMDFSKLVTAYLNLPFKEIKKFIINNKINESNKIRLVLVPTLYGSGSESTQFAVCYINKKKFSVSNKKLKAKKVWHLKNINNSIPKSIKIANILDCFCQASESLTSKNKNSISIDSAKKCISLLYTNSTNYILNNDEKSYKNIIKASELSGKAISISKTTGPHALSYFLTINYNFPHGIAVGWCFVFFLNIYTKFNPKEAFLLIKFYQKLFKSKDVFKSLNSFFKLIKFNIPETSEFILNNVNIDKWINDINIQRLSNGPKFAMDKKLLRIELGKYLKS